MICSKCKTDRDISQFYERKEYGTYRSQCKNCMRLWDRRYRYGLSVEEHERLLVLQEYKCAICGKDGGTALVIDHNHVTGVVRGLLCKGCNTMLGLAKEGTDLLEKAIEYLRERDVS